jgi:hypothetical protein
LARKGKGQPREAVLQQARVLKDLVDEHQTALEGHGWDAKDSTRFEGNIGEAETAFGGRAYVNIESNHKTRGEQAALDAVKAF